MERKNVVCVLILRCFLAGATVAFGAMVWAVLDGEAAGKRSVDNGRESLILKDPLYREAVARRSFLPPLNGVWEEEDCDIPDFNGDICKELDWYKSNSCGDELPKGMGNVLISRYDECF